MGVRAHAEPRSSRRRARRSPRTVSFFVSETDLAFRAIGARIVRVRSGRSFLCTWTSMSFYYIELGFFTEFDAPPGVPRLAISGPIRFADALPIATGWRTGQGSLCSDSGIDRSGRRHDARSDTIPPPSAVFTALFGYRCAQSAIRRDTLTLRSGVCDSG